MTLRVPSEQFADTVSRVLGVKEVYVSQSETGCLMTSFGPKAGVRVLSSHPTATVDECCETLRKAGMKPSQGYWDSGEECGSDAVPQAYVASVAYLADAGQPGGWVDAFSTVPSPAQVLRAMFEEFRETGELEEVSFEEFVRRANPCVVIVSPTEIQGYAAAKSVEDQTPAHRE